MYKMKTFRIRPVQEILSEIESIPQNHRPFIQRVFLGDGDGLVYPQKHLIGILDKLSATFPKLTRVSAYASPNSLTTKTADDLLQLRKRKLRIAYFGLESGDPETLELVNKGFSPAEMLRLCKKAHVANMKLSITAILGLAGSNGSERHALATAKWINELSPEYFSLLTMFKRHNDDYFKKISPLTNGEVLQEALTIVKHLSPQRTILRSNHVSNILHLAGSYPKDRENIILQAQAAMDQGRQHPEWFNSVPDYEEDHF